MTTVPARTLTYSVLLLCALNQNMDMGVTRRRRMLFPIPTKGQSKR